MEHTFYGKQNPYLNNHPLTESRIANVQAHIDHSPYSDVPDPPAWVVAHKRMVAKLVGYLYPVDQVLIRYPESDKSVYARYARSIAYFRIGQLQRALPEIDSLIAEHPDDPYFQEQKGQILYQTGHGREPWSTTARPWSWRRTSRSSAWSWPRPSSSRTTRP